jgi:hypothetical protein
VSRASEQMEVASVFEMDFVSEARQQLVACAGTIQHCLAQLDDPQVWWRPRDGMNTIGNLILHLTGNLRQRFLSVIGGEPFDRDRFAEFTERGPIPRDQLLGRFQDILGRIDQELATMPAERLREDLQYAVVAGPIDGTVGAIIVRTLMHLAGHTQEIVFMTRLQLGEQYAFKNPAGVPPSMKNAI